MHSRGGIRFLPALALAILVFAGLGAMLVLRDRWGSGAHSQNSSTEYRKGVGLKIAQLQNGARMTEVVAALGSPDHTKSDGTYTAWTYVEKKVVESSGQENSIIPGLKLKDKHVVREEGTRRFLCFEGDVLVGNPPRNALGWAIYRRLNPPGPCPATPLENGSDLSTAMSAIVLGRTTLAELETLLGKPWRMLEKDNLKVPYYRISELRGGITYLYLWVKDGVVVWTPYSPPSTEEEERGREPFYGFGTWPGIERIQEEILAVPP